MDQIYSKFHRESNGDLNFDLQGHFRGQKVKNAYFFKKIGISYFVYFGLAGKTPKKVQIFYMTLYDLFAKYCDPRVPYIALKQRI